MEQLADNQMEKLRQLIEKVQDARHQFIAAASGLMYNQTQFKPSEESWSIVEIVEHMVWAELGGINGIWKTCEAIKNSKPVWTGELIHDGLPIEDIIAKTWQQKEKVPESAKPRWGGPIEFWVAALEANQGMLEKMSHQLSGLNPEHIIHPHIISGPLNVYQRMEFLRFHLERHQQQVERVKSDNGFPRA